MRESRERVNYNEHIRRLREIRDLQTDSWNRIQDYYSHIEELGIEINKEIKVSKKLVKKAKDMIVQDIGSFFDYLNVREKESKC
tara:strand:+ start:177 stop:428 length:252 start_codon:yes stop_codon:yes gene_type:complete